MSRTLTTLKDVIVEADKDRRVLTELESEEIISACEEHARENTINKIGKHNVCAIHPYYLELELSDDLAEAYGIKKDLRPLQALERLLRNLDRSEYTSVLFDSYPHYTKRSHKLVDEGVIDKVIFTRHNLGVPVDNGSMQDFRDSEVNYVGGAIAYQCLSVVVKEIRKYAQFFSTKPICDAISYHQPRFFMKVLGHLFLPHYLIRGDKEKVNDLVFHIPSPIYRLFRGVNSVELIQVPR